MADARIKEAQAWIEEVTQQPFSGSFSEHLKSGVVLCNIVNKHKPGLITKINSSRMPFMQMENVQAYINACRSLGVPDQYNFVTIDLFEEKNLNQVALNIITLKRQLGYGFQKQTQEEGEIIKIDTSSNNNSNSEMKLSEQPSTFGQGLSRTGDSLRPGHGVVGDQRNAPNCAACGRSITAGLVNACNTTWHPNCFTCKKCGTKLSSAKYYDHAEKPYCDRCILIVNPQTNVSAVTRNMGFNFNK